MTAIEGQIKNEIYRVVELLGGDSSILGAIGSWGDTMADEDVLAMIRAWREGEKEKEL
jgi:hypothetical protein